MFGGRQRIWKADCSEHACASWWALSAGDATGPERLRLEWGARGPLGAPFAVRRFLELDHSRTSSDTLIHTVYIGCSLRPSETKDTSDPCKTIRFGRPSETRKVHGTSDPCKTIGGICLFIYFIYGIVRLICTHPLTPPWDRHIHRGDVRTTPSRTKLIARPTGRRDTYTWYSRRRSRSAYGLARRFLVSG